MIASKRKDIDAVVGVLQLDLAEKNLEPQREQLVASEPHLSDHPDRLQRGTQPWHS